MSNTISHIDDYGDEYDIPFIETESLDDVFIQNKELVYGYILESLCKLAKSNKDEIPCFSINDLVFAVNRETAVDNIDLCIDYYVLTEEFEKCSKLLTLKSKL